MESGDDGAGFLGKRTSESSTPEEHQSVHVQGVPVKDGVFKDRPLRCSLSFRRTNLNRPCRRLRHVSIFLEEAVPQAAISLHPDLLTRCHFLRGL